jgi:hypothetical protein
MKLGILVGYSDTQIASDQIRGTQGAIGNRGEQ